MTQLLADDSSKILILSHSLLCILLLNKRKTHLHEEFYCVPVNEIHYAFVQESRKKPALDPSIKADWDAAAFYIHL